MKQEPFVFVDGTDRVYKAQFNPKLGDWSLYIFRVDHWERKRLMTDAEVERKYKTRLGDALSRKYEEKHKRWRESKML